MTKKVAGSKILPKAPQKLDREDNPTEFPVNKKNLDQMGKIEKSPSIPTRTIRV